MIDTTATFASLRQLEADLRAIGRQAVVQGATLAAAIARASTDFVTHHPDGLRSTIKWGVAGEFAAFASAGDSRTPQAVFIESGTRAHPILPKLSGGFIGPAAPGQGRKSRGKSAGLLTFMIAGRWISTRGVNHPGTAATHFMQKARDEAERRLEPLLEAAVNRAIQG